MKVYCDHDLEKGKAIVGYKGGSGETDTGYIYAPYLPLMTGGVVVDPNTFQPLVKFMTRYGKTVIQKTEEATTEDGLETTIKRQLCDYYVELTFNNLPDLEKLEFAEDTEDLRWGKTLDLTSDADDAFESAMELLS